MIRALIIGGAAMAGLIGAFRSLPREVASRGITVNAVAPGPSVSPPVDVALAAREIARIAPVCRAGTAHAAADLADVIASARAHITGSSISINGGLA